MPTTLADVVALLYKQLNWLLRTEDFSALLVSYGCSLPEEVRDWLGTKQLGRVAVTTRAISV